MTKILAAIDFSERSDCALWRARQLADQLNAGLAFAHVVEDTSAERIAKTSDEAKSLLADMALEANARWYLKTGDVPAGLLEASNEDDAELIVIGPPGQRSLREKISGATAGRIIRQSRKPVLMAVADGREPYRRILLATDFSAASAQAAASLKACGLLEGAQLLALNVYDTPAVPLMMRASTTTRAIEEYIFEQHQAAAQHLTSFLTAAGLGDAAPILKIGKFSTGKTICAAAKEGGVDLIVIGTRGRGGLTRMVLGSVAEEVLKHSEVDVLAIPV